MSDPASDLDPHFDISQIYETYVNSIMIAEQRRSQISTIYASIVAAAVASLGFSSDVSLTFPAISALFLATLWNAQIAYFQSLAKIKWLVVKDLEDRLPVKPFRREHEFIKKERDSKNHTKRRFSEMETLLPRALQVLSAGYLLFQVLDFASDGKWRFWEALM